MGVDLVSRGRHNLDVSSIEAAARQISERLGINIAIGRWDDGLFIPHQLIERQKGEVSYRMTDESGKGQQVLFYIDAPEEYQDSESGAFSWMEINRESVYISLWAVRGRWSWYWNAFGENEDGSSLETVQAFRKIAKEYYSKLGAPYIYCYADQGPSDLIGNYEDGTWCDFENALRTGKYLDDNAEYLKKEWPGFTSKDLVIFNVSDYLSRKSIEPSHSWWDVFYDDFADLD